MEEETFVCATKNMEHVPEAVLMVCSECPTEIWVCPWNIGKNLICVKCFVKRLKGNKDIKIGVKLQDSLRASSYLKSKV